jgi:phospholipid transport system substrate-binding protein
MIAVKSMVKQSILVLTILCSVLSSGFSFAGEPSTRLNAIVDEMLAIMGQPDVEESAKKAAVMDVVDANVDFTAIAQRVVAKRWKKSADEDKEEFKRLFREVLTNTYYALLSEYTDERVDYLAETIKKERYATVKTVIVSSGKKIPVTYRMILKGGEWRIYDFVAEGISLVRNYGNSYKALLKKEGLAGLNASLKKDLNKED